MAHIPMMRKVHYRNLTNKVKNKINTRISLIDWETELPINSVETAFSKLHNIITKTIDNFAPILTKTIKPNKQPHAPWISTGILNSINRGKALFKKSIMLNASQESKEKYKKYQKALTKIKRRAKFLYFSNKCIELRTNGCKLWKLINKITNKVTDKQTIISKINMDGIIIEQSKEIVNALANYFANIGKTLSKKLPKVKNSIKTYLNKIPTYPVSMYLTPTNAIEIDRIIRSMQNKKVVVMITSATKC